MNVERNDLIESIAPPKTRIRSLIARTTPLANGRRARGTALVLIVTSMIVLIGLTSLAVDVGRVQIAKTELQRAADASARYAVSLVGSSVATVRAAAKDAADDNKVDSSALILANNDIEFGTWSRQARTFTVLTGNARANANAIRITARRTRATGNAIPLVFGQIFGTQFCDVTARSTAMLTHPINVDATIDSTDNPFLAGCPPGTMSNVGNPHNNPDDATTEAPPAVSGIDVYDGQELTFDSITGTANNDSNWDAIYGPDGNFNWVTTAWAGAENGKSDLRAPINCIVGVFLNDSDPTSMTPPAMLDFSTTASRDFSQLAPELRQTFFIGDSLRDDGTPQRFIVPPGATRLYICNWDSYEWNNNNGTRNVVVKKLRTISLVK